MAKTLVEKVSSPEPDVSIFKISGVLGYHENGVLEKFFSECGKRNIHRLIIDFSHLTSLGGGCATIIRKAALDGEVTICIVGASATVRNFLENKGETPIAYLDDHEEAIKHVKSPQEPARVGARAATEQKGSAKTGETAGTNSKSAPKSRKVDPRHKPAASASPRKPAEKNADDSHDRDLEKKIVQYRALFSVNADFNRIHEKSRLLDAFLLTAIAQVGVEAAAFLEFQKDAFVPISWKGFETADPKGLSIRKDDVDVELWHSNPQIASVTDAPLSDGVRERIEKWGFPYAAPFIVHNEFRALVLLGKPIRNQLDADASDYLAMLIKQAAIAYENSCHYEEESQRTLGLVHSLISMIEENTARGNTELMVNYTYAVAKAMHYPEEHIHNLMYATVLRDIGMIKVSDLIVRTPRELGEEEWNIIKHHPIEGAEMLRRMKFAEHTAKVVLCHHERFNGEGYPGGLQGPQIPLGARIVSVVESYAAMLQERPTRAALSDEEALNTLRENWGIRYDPEVIKSFVEVVEEELRTGDRVTYPGVDLFKG